MLGRKGRIVAGSGLADDIHIAAHTKFQLARTSRLFLVSVGSVFEPNSMIAA
jgi:hypothetical protein